MSDLAKDVAVGKEEGTMQGYILDYMSFLVLVLTANPSLDLGAFTLTTDKHLLRISHPAECKTKRRQPFVVHEFDGPVSVDQLDHAKHASLCASVLFIPGFPDKISPSLPSIHFLRGCSTHLE